MKTLIFTLVSLTIVLPCQARIIYVDVNAPADFNTIQAAIDDANSIGDTISVAPGTYNEKIDLSGKAITLKGAEGADILAP